MFFRKKGQSIVELTAVSVIVTIAILLGGPRLISSINYSFERVHSQSQEQEVIAQAEVSGLQGEDCVCSEPSFAACGANTPGSCPYRQEDWRRTCDPLGCEAGLAAYGVHIATLECQPNDSYPNPRCCTPWDDLLCGVNAVSGTNPDGTCPDGMMNQFRTCGSDGVEEFRCAQHAECNFFCTGAPVKASYCEDETIRLTQTIATTHVEDEEDCTDGRKCEAYCDPGYEPDGNGGACVCEDGMFVIDTIFTGGGAFFSASTLNIPEPMINIVNGEEVPEEFLHEDNHTLRWDLYWFLDRREHYLNMPNIPMKSATASDYRMYSAYSYSMNVKHSIPGNFANLISPNCPSWLAANDFGAGGVWWDNHQKSLAIGALYDAEGKLTGFDLRSCNLDSSGNRGWGGSISVQIRGQYECDN